MRFGAFARLSTDTGGGETGVCEGCVLRNFVPETGLGEGAAHDVAVADEEDGRGAKGQFYILAATGLRWFGLNVFGGTVEDAECERRSGFGFPGRSDAEGQIQSSCFRFAGLAPDTFRSLGQHMHAPGTLGRA